MNGIFDRTRLIHKKMTQPGPTWPDPTRSVDISALCCRILLSFWTVNRPDPPNSQKN